ncbi:MAG: ATP-binding protein [Thermoproteota archaeon]|nr:ATP-binding protein [Thermoproteota archaeon]
MSSGKTHKKNGNDKENTAAKTCEGLFNSNRKNELVNNHNQINPLTKSNRKRDREKTTVIYGEEMTTRLILKTLNNAKNRWDNYANSKGPTIAIGVEQLRKGMRNAYDRGVKIRYISEITKHNINYCKELMKIAEVRHLDNAKGGMAVSDTEYIATANLQEARPVTHLIHSNVKEIVEQQQFIFESFWNNAINAEQRIMEIEEGYERIETRIIDNAGEIYSKINSLSEGNGEILVCSNMGLLKIVYNSLFDIYQRIMEKYEEGNHKGIRWITFIRSKEDAALVKLFIDLGIKIRSVKNLLPINYLVSDKVFFSNVENVDGTIEKKVINSMLVSNDALYINQFKAVFEETWKNGTDAQDIVENIENGLESEIIDVITRSNNVEKVYLDLLRSAYKEIILIFPTANAFLRQYRIGVIDAIIDASANRNIKVRILVPKSNNIIELIERSKKHHYLTNNNKNDNIQIRHIHQSMETKSTILVIDKKVSLVMELKDDTKERFHEAIGLSTYSNSKAGVLSYVSIFENLWEQTELYQELEEANENLRKSENLQKDFIHIAAHELRNPIQPILGIAEILKLIVNQNESANQDEVRISKSQINVLLDSIIKNTKKLIRITDDVLDITRIETDSLSLHRETIDLRRWLKDFISDYKNLDLSNSGTLSRYKRLVNEEKKIKEKYTPNITFLKSEQKNNNNDEPLKSMIDKSRISQVMSNLLDNALKFTSKGGKIDVDIETNSNGDNGKYAIITIKDNGKGIDSEVQPKLFTKFATKSDKGTGLGLFICKSIIEAHGGKIWAQNNEDGKGATFGFSLPLL